MEQVPREQEITKKREATESENRDYADSVLKKYEEKINQVVHGKFKGITDVSLQDRQDIASRVCHVLEFEEIYRAEAKERMKLSKGRGQKGSTAEGLPFGKAVFFMAKEAPAGEQKNFKKLFSKKMMRFLDVQAKTR